MLRSEAEKETIVQSLVGLPFVGIELNPSSRFRVVGTMPDGTTKVRVADCEDVWNAALCIDAIDGPGCYRASVASPGGLVVLSIAERLYGCTIEQALPVWLLMDKTSYGAWAERPRVQWPRIIVN